MDLTYEIILIIGVLIAILEIFKLACRPKRDEAGGLDIGTCMTIGSRDVQEDQVGTLVTESGVMAALADGAGKMFGGRIAAKLAVDTCTELFRDYHAFNNPQYYFRKAFRCANTEILKALEDESRGNASLGCVMIRENCLYYALVGNVSISVFREGALVPVSTGHTVAVLAEQKFREGKLSRQSALTLLENHRRYNYLGRDEFRDIEIFDAPVSLNASDIVVMMSDGVYELLGTKEVEEVLGGAGSCQQKALAIIEKVNVHTGEDKDNASIILIHMGTGI